MDGLIALFFGQWFLFKNCKTSFSHCKRHPTYCFQFGFHRVFFVCKFSPEVADDSGPAEVADALRDNYVFEDVNIDE